jgi:hypothetical protein
VAHRNCPDAKPKTRNMTSRRVIVKETGSPEALQVIEKDLPTWDDLEIKFNVQISFRLERSGTEESLILSL